MADKLMYILTQLNKATNQNSLKVPKVIKPTKKKNVIIKKMGTSVISSLLASFSDFKTVMYKYLIYKNKLHCR